MFTTSKATLTRDPESMLARMIGSEVPAARDSQGNIFIDRSPDAFRVVLDFLRTERVNLEGSKCTLKQLEVEADYFGLSGLLESIRYDDGARELMFVMTSGGTLSGPIYRLRVDGVSSKNSKYLFKNVQGVVNSMGMTLPGGQGVKESFESNREAKLEFSGDVSNLIKMKRSVWFCVPWSSISHKAIKNQKGSPLPFAMMDLEAKILENWDRYWQGAGEFYSKWWVEHEYLSTEPWEDDVDFFFGLLLEEHFSNLGPVRSQVRLNG